MLLNIDKHSSLFKFIVLAILAISSTYSSADEYVVEDIINLEQRLKKLKSEIYITKTTAANNYTNQNSAVYHLKKKSWQKSLQSISPGKTTSTEEYKHYTDILYGISLQGMNRKKEALNYYNGVPKISNHYATAQLNIALLHMHDGLTSKSFTIINKILTDPSIILTEQIKNHTLLILGYLYYREGKYTESRKVFRNIEIESIHSNSALIGIALNALQLKDYDASQHVLSLLNKRSNYDIAVDESYLLLAFTYESQNKYIDATISYNDAIKYYEQRIKNINSLLQKNQPLTIDEILHEHIFICSHNKIDLSETIPETFSNNYILLKQLISSIEKNVGTDNKIHTRAIALSADYNKLINKLLINLLSKRKSALLDYLNQSRYGLAISNDKLLSSEKN